VPKAKKAKSGPTIIKKYANRRLYNTETSSYVTLDTLSQMVKDGVEFEVFDAKSGNDITKSVLTQIIFEEEAKGQNLLPIPFLRQVISFYGDSMQAFVPSYLEMSMDSFTKKQDEMRTRLQDSFGSGQGFQKFEEQIATNLAMFQDTMRMFSPFASMGVNPQSQDAGSSQTSGSAPGKSEIDELKSQLSEIQAQLSKIAEKE
jgi:polyhydroxyalkanoate synthesis repressor PhaR